jgi:uncharacterized protein (TIGR02145 family)
MNNGLFGKLYNHFATRDSRGLCPTGWHVPSDAEWTSLENHLGGSNVAGGALKSTLTQPTLRGWASPNTGATNSSRFDAFPGGRAHNDGNTYAITAQGYWWSSTMPSANTAWYRGLHHSSNLISKFDILQTYGFSVRCIKD